MRIGAYSRVSTDDQDTGLQVYRKSAKDFCERHGHSLVHNAEDEDVSGGTRFSERPAGSVLYKMAISKQLDGILSDNVSRMFRSMSDGMHTAELFNEIGVKLFFVDYGKEPIDVSTEQGFMWFTMQLMMAQLERMKIAKRTADAHRMRRRNGLATSHEPYGYTHVDGKRVEDVNEMAVVRAIVTWRKIEGRTLDWIADSLNINKVPSKKGGKWSAKTVSDVLKFQDKLSTLA